MLITVKQLCFCDIYYMYRYIECDSEIMLITLKQLSFCDIYFMYILCTQCMSDLLIIRQEKNFYVFYNIILIMHGLYHFFAVD